MGSTESKGRSAKLGAAIFIILGVVALSAAGWQALQTVHILRTASHAMGVVLPDGSLVNETMTAGHPTIAFRKPDGQVVRYTQNGLGPTRVGSKVQIIYKADDPKGAATISSFWMLWGQALLPLILGLGLIGFPLIGGEIGVRGRW